MNPLAVLALLGDLQVQIDQLRNENAQLRAALAERSTESS